MRVKLSSAAEIQLRKLKKFDLERYRKINMTLDEIALNPYQGKHLEGQLAGVQVWRSGDWRNFTKS